MFPSIGSTPPQGQAPVITTTFTDTANATIGRMPSTIVPPPIADSRADNNPKRPPTPPQGTIAGSAAIVQSTQLATSSTAVMAQIMAQTPRNYEESALQATAQPVNIGGKKEGITTDGGKKAVDSKNHAAKMSLSDDKDEEGLSIENSPPQFIHSQQYSTALHSYHNTTLRNDSYKADKGNLEESA